MVRVLAAAALLGDGRIALLRMSLDGQQFGRNPIDHGCRPAGHACHLSDLRRARPGHPDAKGTSGAAPGVLAV